MSKQIIDGQFAPRLIEMLDSPAYRALSRAAHQVLARIEIELAHHGGMDNGKLPATYTQFVKYGIRRNSIATAIRELINLGFIEVTEQGRAGNAEWRRPTHFRLTYLHAYGAKPTHEWRRISEDNTIMIAKGARRPGSNSARNEAEKPTRKNRTPAPKTLPTLAPKTLPNLGPKNVTNRVKNANISIVTKTGLLLESSPSRGRAQASKQPSLLPPDP